MIDLRHRDLPDSIEFEGAEYRLNTDFRVWIEFDRALREDDVAISDVFDGDVPGDARAFESVLSFYMSENATPHGTEKSDARALDLILDGDYIVASFMQAYGIDLTSVEYMHWHLFKALLNGLPDDTVMGRAIGYRTYRPSSQKHEEVMAKMRRQWTLPTKVSEEEKAAEDEFAARLGL